MVISSVETFATEYVALVRVRTDEGDEGWGQVSPYNADITAEILHRQIARHVLGMDADDIDGVTQAVLDREHKFQGTYLYRALCGIDTALWDIRGKRAGQSVHQLLGGNRSEFPVYASSMKRDITPRPRPSACSRCAKRTVTTRSSSASPANAVTMSTSGPGAARKSSGPCVRPSATR